MGTTDPNHIPLFVSYFFCRRIRFTKHTGMAFYNNVIIQDHTYILYNDENSVLVYLGSQFKQLKSTRITISQIKKDESMLGHNTLFQKLHIMFI